MIILVEAKSGCRDVKIEPESAVVKVEELPNKVIYFVEVKDAVTVKKCMNTYRYIKTPTGVKIENLP